MGLHSLRHHISVIPQTPFLFKSNVKINLDPFLKHKDEELWRVLEDTHLKSIIEEVSLILFSCQINSILISLMQHRSCQWEKDSYFA